MPGSRRHTIAAASAAKMTAGSQRLATKPSEAPQTAQSTPEKRDASKPRRWR